LPPDNDVQCCHLVSPPGKSKWYKMVVISAMINLILTPSASEK